MAVILCKDYLEQQEFVSELSSSIKSGNYYIDNNQQINDLLFIDFNIDMKKEFTLSKSSNLRKEIISYSIDYFDNNNIEINSLFSDGINDFSKDVSSKIMSKDYSLSLVNKIKTPGNVIDNLFELLIIDPNENEIPSKIYNQWNLKPIFVDMVLGNDEIKNKIIIINDYDEFSNDHGNNIFKYIDKLKENNIIILLTRKTNFLRQDFNLMKSFNYLHNDVLDKLIFNETTIKKYVLMKDYDGEAKDFDKYEVNSQYLVEDDDVEKHSIVFSNVLKNIIEQCISSEDGIIDLSYLSEAMYIATYSYLLSNKESLKINKVEYKNNLSKIGKYILEKYLG